MGITANIDVFKKLFNKKSTKDFKQFSETEYFRLFPNNEHREIKVKKGVKIENPYNRKIISKLVDQETSEDIGFVTLKITGTGNVDDPVDIQYAYFIDAEVALLQLLTKGES